MLFLVEFQSGFAGTVLVLVLDGITDAREGGREGGLESPAGVAARLDRVVRRTG